MKRIVIVVVVAMMAGFSAPASADITFWLGRADSGDLDIEGTQVWGGAVGFSFAKYFGVELVVDYLPNSELPFDLEEVEETLGVDVQVDMIFISGNILIQYPISGLTPYFTIGYGGFGARLANKEFDIDAMSGTTTTNYGFGIKYDVIPWFAVRGDYRVYKLSLEGDELGDVFKRIDNPTFSRLAVGVSLTF